MVYIISIQGPIFVWWYTNEWQIHIKHSNNQQMSKIIESYENEYTYTFLKITIRHGWNAWRFKLIREDKILQ